METHEQHQGPDIQKEFKSNLSGAAETLHDLKGGGKINFGKEFMNAFEILKLNGKKMEEVANNKASALPALLFILLGVLAFHIGVYFFFASMARGLLGISITPPILDMLISFVLYAFISIVEIFVLDFVGNVAFKGQGKFGQLFRVLGYANLAMVVSIFMQIGFIGGIWMLVVSYIALNKIKKLDSTNTILTLVISLVIVAVLTYLLNLLFVNVLHFGGVFSLYNSEYYQMMNVGRLY